MTPTITAAMDRDTLSRRAQVPLAGTRDPTVAAGVSPGQSAPPAAGTGVLGVTVQGAAAANGIGAMGTTTWGTGCRRGAGGTRVVAEVRGVVVAMVRDGVVGIRGVPQDWTTGDGITEVPL